LGVIACKRVNECVDGLPVGFVDDSPEKPRGIPALALLAAFL